MDEVLPKIFKATESGDQFSVRYLQEWAVSYIVAKYPILLPTLWKHLKNVMTICSLLIAHTHDCSLYRIHLTNCV